MNNLRRWQICIGICAVMLVARTMGAQVVERVIDGDTVAVRGIGTVRLIGVDTPETVDPRRPVQYFGREASAFLKELVEGRRVTLQYDWERTDRYGRTLAYLYLADGTFVNAEILRQGYGHAYTRFPFKHFDTFRRLEREARDASRGLWAAAPVPAAASEPTPAPSSSRCHGTTNSGAQCSRRARAGSRYCWQHQG